MSSLFHPRFEMIVGLHDIAMPPAARGDELSCWVPFSHVASQLDEMLENTQSQGVSLRITSDDGFRSDYDILLPWLQERGLVGTFFIPTRYLDKPGRLTTAQLRELAAAGMSIGVHGALHLDWTGIPEAVFIADVHEGRERLQDLLGASVHFVAPPFGRYNERVLQHLIGQGFSEIHTVQPGLAPVGLPIKPRNMIRASQIDAVVARSRDPGGPRDIARYRLRRVRSTLKSLVGAA